MAAKFEIEVGYKVYDNDKGHKVDVGMDSDSLGLVEIIGDEHFGGENSKLVLEPDMALKVAEAITRCVQDIKARGD